ncbi:MAG TPA: glycosyltransferase [Oceanobacillus sp.]|nr:glycosyltransferase [Oceanobacillus sp.]
MRILLLTSSLPYPAHGGGALRTLGIIRGLYEAGHDITLVGFHDEGVSVASTPLAEYCTRIETVTPQQRPMSDRLRALLLSSQPDIAGRLESAALRAKLSEVLHSAAFDIVQFQGLEMAIYLPFVRQLQPAAKLIYDAFNAEYVLQRRIAEVEQGNLRRLPAMLYSRIQAQRIEHFEREICQQADAVIAVSQEDVEALRPFRSDGKIHLLPNGIFVDDYVKPRETLDLGKNVLIFTGKMDYRPNVDAALWFASSILPLIQSRIPETKLYIVGQQPHHALHALGDNIEVTGWVAEVQPFLYAADLYVAPLRMGAGTRLKILEAMAAGRAVVGTPVAASGLVPEAHQAMVLTSNEKDFADAVIRLLKSPEERAALGAEAQQVVRRHYDWSALIPCLLQIHQDVVGG